MHYHLLLCMRESLMLFRLVASFLIATFASASLAAQAPSTAAAQGQSRPAAESKDRVCEDIVMTGSRLASKRFCGTREEWAERKLQDRQAIERIQIGSCVAQQTSATGRPSC